MRFFLAFSGASRLGGAGAKTILFFLSRSDENAN